MPEEQEDPFELARGLTFRDSQAELHPPDHILDEKVPFLGVSRRNRGVGMVSVPITNGTTGTPTRFIVDRPTLFLPRFELLSAAPGNFRFFDICYAPVDIQSKAFQTPASVQNEGIRLPAGACHFWAKGIWWIFVSSMQAGNLNFSTIAVDDPFTTDRIIRDSNGASGSFEIALAAATLTTILEGPSIAGCVTLILSNSGANPANLSFGDNNPADGNTGIALAAGATLVLNGREIPMARLQGFSTGGTNIGVVTISRFIP